MTEKQIDQAIAEFTGEQRPYCSDLDAMHEAEKMLTNKERMTYMSNLHIHGSCDYKKKDWYDLTHATAAKRAEALLRTIGQWKD